MTSYKAEKEAFVSGTSGGSVLRINLVCSTAITSYALYTRFKYDDRSKGSFARASVEFGVLILPLLFATTLFSSHPLAFNVVLAIPSIVLSKRQSSDKEAPIKPLARPKSIAVSPKDTPESLWSKNVFNKAFVTVYRAHMMLMTVICILAVDFPVFPREFQKAETWGTSLMDLGVGSFVFSLGLISALPLLRKTETRRMVPALWSSIKRSAGVLLLGVVRVISVKGVDYPEHVSEYGIHWNFFFTLGLLPVFGVFFERLAPLIDLHWAALCLSVVHQYVLGNMNLQYWALAAERTSLLSQNKEGLSSLPGYVAIYAFGMATGLYTLPPDPYFFHSQRKSLDENVRRHSKDEQRELAKKRAKAWQDKPGKLLSVLGSYTIVWWTAYQVTIWFQWTVSRRLANLPYVLWIAAFNTSFLFAYLALQTSVSQSKAGSGAGAPALFEAVNKNGLAVFLVANLLTGGVNLTMDTIRTGHAKAMVVLISYLAVVLLVAWALRGRRLRF